MHQYNTKKMHKLLLNLLWSNLVCALLQVGKFLSQLSSWKTELATLPGQYRDPHFPTSYSSLKWREKVVHLPPTEFGEMSRTID